MLADTALRHQIILPEQRFVFDYWRSKCKNGKLPCREDIDPFGIQTHLPMISILETCKKTQNLRYKYRLAGTGFWSMFQEEIQGRYLDELPIGDRKDYWHRVLSRVIQTRRPSAGVTKPGTPNKAHLAQFWIRLPLSDDGVNVTQILGFDHLVKYEELGAYQHQPQQISA